LNRAVGDAGRPSFPAPANPFACAVRRMKSAVSIAPTVSKAASTFSVYWSIRR
jgi:hypothetical protein